MKPIIRAGAHITGLWAVAVAQPLFDVLGRAPEFLVAQRADAADHLILAVWLTLLVPGIILGALAIIGLFSGRVARLATATSIGILAGVITTQVAYRCGASGWPSTLPVFSVTAVLAGIAWSRVAAVRVFLNMLSAAALIVPGAFLISTARGPAALERGTHAAIEPRRSPVVVVVFDELSLVSLMNGEGRINAARYPHLAALAADGIWFRNATAVSDYTRWALPAMLTGRYPTARSEPTPKDHPDTLFSVLGGSHRVEVFEAVTSLCPPSLCAPQDSRRSERQRAIAADLLVVAAHILLPPDAREGLPDLAEDWAGFGDADSDADTDDADNPSGDTPPAPDWRREWRSARGKDHLASAREFIDGIAAEDPAASLYFMHTLATHHPARWAPTGQRIANRRRIPGVKKGTITGDAWVAEQWQYAHLMQAGLADLLVGQVRDRLAAAGRYDAALIVITADHGASFRPGGRMRNFTPENAPDIVPVPFIVKLPAGSPGPPPGTVDDSNVETIDVLPTVADALNVTVPWRIDGQSALRSAPRRSGKRVYHNVATTHATYGSNELVASRDAAVKRQTELFGDGASPDFSLPELRHLIGRELSSFTSIGETKVRLVVENHDLFQNVDVRAPELPVQMVGRVRGGMTAASTNIRVVVALNGRIVATTRLWPGQVRWMVMLPPAALKPGANRVDLFVVDPADNDRLLKHT